MYDRQWLSTYKQGVVGKMKSSASFIFLAVYTGFGAYAHSTPTRVQEATDLILKLCIAGGEDIEVTRQGNSVQVSGDNDTVTIKKNESSGLVGGISRSITDLSAQQASEARNCTKKYLKQLLDILLSDTQADPAKKSEESFGTIHILSPPGPQCAVNYQIIINNEFIVPQNPDWLVPNVKLGPSKWVIRGNVQCFDAFCASNADNQSGEIYLQNGRSYVFYWSIIPGSPKGSECRFVLQ